MPDIRITDLQQQPEWIGPEFDGEPVHGWRAITAPSTDTPCQDGCLAPGSSPHYHTHIVAYMVITDRSYLEFDLDGLCIRAAVLHQPLVTNDNIQGG